MSDLTRYYCDYVLLYIITQIMTLIFICFCIFIIGLGFYSIYISIFTYTNILYIIGDCIIGIMLILFGLILILYMKTFKIYEDYEEMV